VATVSDYRFPSSDPARRVIGIATEQSRGRRQPRYRNAYRSRCCNSRLPDAGRQLALGSKTGQLLAKLRRAPEARVGELELGVRRALVLSLVATITTLNEQIRQLERQIATAIREHPDGPIFLSLFRKPNSVICAAELLAEIGDCRARYPRAIRSPPTPARPPSRSSPANAKPPASGGPATSACARHS